MNRMYSTLFLMCVCLCLVASHSNAQFVQQGGKLVGAGAVGNAGQGKSVALSADGNTAIVGACYDNSSVGAAWIFTRSGDVWTEQGSKLVGTGASVAAKQGYSVAISADGNTAIVGGIRDSLLGGAAWIFTRSGGVWTQQGSKLIGTGAVGKAQQGYSVALSADGNTAIVGGMADSSYFGAAWVFTRSGGVWTQQGHKLVGTNGIPADQGMSVALSASGDTAVVGGSYDDYNTGAVWVFTRSGGVWTERAKLVGTGKNGSSNQGATVAISEDGATVITGGYGDSSNYGAVWVFALSGGTWIQQGGKLVGTGASGNAYQGVSVSLSADGNIALVGGSVDASDTGAVWVWTRSGGVWTQQGSKLVGTGATGVAYQGGSVSISADGSTALVGGSNDSSGMGASWVYSNLALPIQLLSFSGEAEASGRVKLMWSTASEIDNYGFYVERRLRSDMVFRTVSSLIPGAGTSLEGHSYSWTDSSVAPGSYVYRLKQVDLNNNVTYSWEILVAGILSVGSGQALPAKYELLPCYPNPFNPSTSIGYALPRAGGVLLTVFDVLGRPVTTLVHEVKGPGRYTVRWDAAGVPSGVYFYRLVSGAFMDTKTFVVLK